MTKTTNKLELFLASAKKLAVIGVGNEDAGDDAAGMICARALEGLLDEERVRVFLGGGAPENVTGEVRRFAPTHVLIVDACELGKGAGETIFIEDLVDMSPSFSTHRMPMSVFIDFIESSMGCKAALLAIQPSSLEYGAPVSEAVSKAARSAAKLVASLLG